MNAITESITIIALFTGLFLVHFQHAAAYKGKTPALRSHRSVRDPGAHAHAQGTSRDGAPQQGPADAP